MMNSKVRNMCFVALMAAVLCVTAPLSVPIGPIPITLAAFFVYLSGAVLGGTKGTAAVALYVLIGIVGLPVFSGYSGGLAKVVGVTGGFIVGYIPCAAIVGFCVDKLGDRTEVKIAGHGFSWIYPVSMLAGTAVLYALGTVWFVMQTGNTLNAALAACVFPFIPGDLIKIALATITASALRKRLKSFGILK